ncbi:MAG TPA: alpha-L-arabinofuranosidase [Chitinophagaceae bacterium]|jgi:hypothetical protein|nr:alpha-L-arabinofuranosidase [Chitinophagaceae bacterium]
MIQYTIHRHALFISGFLILMAGCKKKENLGEENPPPPPVDTTTVQPPVDPPLASTIGFFMNDWQPRNFVKPAATDTTLAAAGATTITINPSGVITKVPRSLFGNNTNPYMTQMVDQPVLLNHLTQLNPHILRFPGGNLSSVFLWNTPKGQIPAGVPDSLVNADGVKEKAGYWYGTNEEEWTLSVDNYYRMLGQTGNQGIITVNYGLARYGTGSNPVADAAHLAADWVRYDRGRTKYWEVGNESNGTWQAGYRIDVSKNKDGQPEKISGALYGQHFKVFADSMQKAAQEVGATIYIGAQLMQEDPPSWAPAIDKEWNAKLFGQAGNRPDFYIIHSYYTPYNTNSNGAEILASAVTETKKMMDWMHTTTSRGNVQMKPVALTEWNIFAVGSRQMVSHVSGMHAVLVLGELMKNKYGMASRWDLANGWDNGNDHGLFAQADEPGVDRWNPRPAFYHMYFFQKMLGDRLVSSTHTNTALETYASSFTSGEVGLTVVNKSTGSQSVQLAFRNFQPGSRVYWYTLTGGSDNGEFSRKVFVNGQGPSGVAGGPSHYATLKPYSAAITNGVRLTLPPRSVVCMVVERK